jgi:protein involved in polysaccharide export with SLBB domain
MKMFRFNEKARQLVVAFAAIVAMATANTLSISNGAIAAPSIRADYRLGQGDEIRVVVFDEDDMSGEFVLDESGRFAMPLIGMIEADGRTVRELEAALVKKLSAGYLRDPKVSVDVISNRPFYVVGEVRNPGSFPYVSGMRVMNAVAYAGGFTDSARKRSLRIERRHGGEATEVRASPETRVLPGDVVVVQSSSELLLTPAEIRAIRERNR